MAYNVEYQTPTQMAYGSKANASETSDPFEDYYLERDLHHRKKNYDSNSPEDSEGNSTDAASDKKTATADLFDSVIKMTKNGFSVQGYSDNQGIHIVRYGHDPAGSSTIATIFSCLPTQRGADLVDNQGRGGYNVERGRSRRGKATVNISCCSN
jgi:hypothetical protein